MERESAKHRLIAAAKERFYRQGIQRTTLADIAQDAGVPLGNVYYHFKTKESLIQAVIASYLSDLQTMFAQLEREPDPRQRLMAFIRNATTHAPQMAQFGCPHGSLCQELDKAPGTLAGVGASILQCYLSWVNTQFTLLGKSDDAQMLAEALLAQLQGIYLLTSVFRAPDLLQRQLEHTIDLFVATA